MSPDRPATMLVLGEVASLLRLPPWAVEALVASGYLAPPAGRPFDLRFPLSDIKAFLARNADNGSGLLIEPADLLAHGSALDSGDLLSALEERTREMAGRVYDIFAAAVPEAGEWLGDKNEFIDQAQARFEAMLALAGQGGDLIEGLVGDLQMAGAAAARDDASLPQLLVLLRISRDLVVETAIELAGNQPGGGGALSQVVTRVLTGMDSLTDALAYGYWTAVVSRGRELLARYEHFARRSSNGVYETDLDGRITFANQSLALLVGRRRATMKGEELASVLRPVDHTASVAPLLAEHGEGGYHLTMAIRRPDGVRRVLGVYTTARRLDGKVVGFQGIVRDETAERDREEDRRKLTEELGEPLAAIAGVGGVLERTDELTPAQRRRMGLSIRRHSQRLERLAGELAALGRLEGRLTPQPVELLRLVTSAVASVGRRATVAVSVEPGVTGLVDPFRMEQVVGHLVDHLAVDPPVEITAQQVGDEVVLAVQGAVSPATQEPDLGVARGLIEAMGGRVWREEGERTSRFCLVVPAPVRGL